jgi:4-amino-4-deoxy-L-arabinose transferase-like glycosyltransferase
MPAAPRSSLRGALLLGLAAGALNAAIALPFLGRYGWHCDELYFLAAAKHPALGYVDFPPLIAWLGWLLHALAGNALIAFRLFGIGVAIVVAVLVSLIARELGGGRVAQAGAALIAATSPIVLGAGSIYHTTYLDLAATLALLYVAMLAIGRPAPRLWPLVGLAAGIGLEAKYTIFAVILGLFAGLLVTSARRLLATPGPWVAAAIAFLCLLPNLVWQAQKGWPSLDFFGSQHQATHTDTPHLVYAWLGAFLLGAGSLLAVIGLVWLWHRRPDLRVFVVTPVVVTTLFFFEDGRSYYPLPADFVLVAAGAVALSGWVARGSRLRLAPVGALLCLHGAVLAFALPLVVPIRSVSGMSRQRLHEQTFFGDELGWYELVDLTAKGWMSMRPAERADAVILASNYGEAGAISLLGPSRGLPQPVSGHLSWQYWRPKQLPQHYAVVVGGDPNLLRWLCSSWAIVGFAGSSHGFVNEQATVWIHTCKLRRPLGELWNQGIARNTF